MDKAKTRRWAVLLTALTLTLVAIFYPVEERQYLSAQEVVPVAARPSVKPAPVQSGTIEWIATDVDPFAPRGWQPPPQEVPISEPVVAAMPTEAQPPPPPPPLPYTFVGQMRDGNNKVIYLSLGDRAVLARLGDVLEGGYKVIAVSANQIEFESVSHGYRQTLPIPVQE